MAVGRLSRPMKCAALENLSITEEITDFPVETGKSVTKTREIWEQGCDKPRHVYAFKHLFINTVACSHD